MPTAPVASPPAAVGEYILPILGDARLVVAVATSNACMGSVVLSSEKNFFTPCGLSTSIFRYKLLESGLLGVLEDLLGVVGAGSTDNVALFGVRGVVVVDFPADRGIVVFHSSTLPSTDASVAVPSVVADNCVGGNPDTTEINGVAVVACS